MKKTINTIFTLFLFITSINASWEKVYEFPNEIIIRKIYPVTQDLIIAIGTDGSIVRSTDAGETWAEIQGFVSQTFSFELKDIEFANETNGYMFGTKADIPFTKHTDHIFKTTDGGVTWNEISTGDDFDNDRFHLVSIDVLSDNIIYLGGGEDNNGDFFVPLLLRSTDGGQNWSKVEVPGEFSLQSVRFRDENEGYIQPGQKLFVTNDSGVTWDSVATPFEDINNTDYEGFRFAGDNFFIAGGAFYFMSSDGLQTWDEVSPFPDNQFVSYWNPFWLDESVSWAWNWSGMIKTTDGGLNWEIVVEIESLAAELNLLPGFPSWDYFAFTSVSTGFIAAGKYIVKTTDNDMVTDVESTESLPSDFAISQNYPNPFNPSTIISYSIPVESSVNLSIFNVLGEEIVTLQNNIQNAGTHNLKWNAEGLSSGVYIYSISAVSTDGSRKFTSSKKMILTK